MALLSFVASLFQHCSQLLLDTDDPNANVPFAEPGDVGNFLVTLLLKLHENDGPVQARQFLDAAVEELHSFVVRCGIVFGV
jgi:hypothetical protein